jgi:DNA mismatch endonuclease (patch repair protein)
MTLIAPGASSDAARAVMRGNRRRDTKPEIILRSTLFGLGLRFRKDYRIQLKATGVRADVVFPARRVAVFVDGCFWHRCPIHGSAPRTNAPYWRMKLDRNVHRDEVQTAALRREGWEVIRIWEHEDPTDAAHRIAGQVRQEATPDGTFALVP